MQLNVDRKPTFRLLREKFAWDSSRLNRYCPYSLVEYFVGVGARGSRVSQKCRSYRTFSCWPSSKSHLFGPNAQQNFRSQFIIITEIWLPVQQIFWSGWNLRLPDRMSSTLFGVFANSAGSPRGCIKKSAHPKGQYLTICRLVHNIKGNCIRTTKPSLKLVMNQKPKDNVKCSFNNGFNTNNTKPYNTM